MSDLLLELSRRPTARALVRRLGLPLPLPHVLDRARGPYEERPLEGRSVLVGGALRGAVGETLARGVLSAGADVVAHRRAQVFEAPAEAWARRVLGVEDLSEGARVDAMVFDATEIDDPSSLRWLYDFFHPHLRSLRSCGRVVVVGRPATPAPSAAASAARKALEGFVRSLAKEIGRRGSTAQLLVVEEGAEPRMDGPLRFFLSDRSAFITGQPVRISTAAEGTAEGRHVRPLEGKVALVTGAARGIGAATVELLATEGAKVVCLDRPQDEALCEEVARAHDGVVLSLDLADADAPDRIADALAVLGGVDVLVHNAGVTRDKTLAKMSEAHWEQAVEVNLGAVVRVTERVLERELLHDGGRLVCLSSVAGIAGNLGQTNYAASKAGVIGYVQALAPQLAARGVTANAIAPGFIETRLTDAMPFAIREAARRLSALGQGGRPEDVAQAITFLATPGAQGITGSMLRVCGGAFVGA